MKQRLPAALVYPIIRPNGSAKLTLIGERIASSPALLNPAISGANGLSHRQTPCFLVEQD